MRSTGWWNEICQYYAEIRVKHLNYCPDTLKNMPTVWKSVSCKLCHKRTVLDKSCEVVDARMSQGQRVSLKNMVWVSTIPAKSTIKFFLNFQQGQEPDATKNSSGDEIANVNFLTTTSYTYCKLQRREPPYSLDGASDSRNPNMDVHGGYFYTDLHHV